MRRTINDHLRQVRLTRIALVALVGLVVSFRGPVSAQDCVFQSPEGKPYRVTWNFQPQTGPVQGSTLKVVAFGDSLLGVMGTNPRTNLWV